MAVDRPGNLFIADTHNHRIRMVSVETGLIRTVAGNGHFHFSGDGGHALNAGLVRPHGLALDPEGGLYIADHGASRLRRVAPPFNQLPSADAGSDRTSIVGETVIFDASRSADSDGHITAVRWSFGDGATGGAAFGTTSTHVYERPGQFVATLTVTDNGGAIDSDSAVITVLTLAEFLQEVRTVVERFNLQQGVANSLDAKLRNVTEAVDAANANQRGDAAKKLAALIEAVEAQRGKELTETQGDELVSLARRVMAVLAA